MSNKDLINLTRHILGNHVVEGRLLHTRKSFRTIDDVRKIQHDVANQFREKLIKDEITDSEVWEVLSALEESDWGDESSYEKFRKIYDGYTASVDDEARRERDNFFNERKKV